MAYLITFRCYGTWLHGDGRGSIDRYNNCYGTPFIPSNKTWQKYNKHSLKHSIVELDAVRRAAVEESIRVSCETRGWLLLAINVRTNHVHVVVSADCQSETVLSAFKANATHKMRESKCWAFENSPWSYGGSKRYLWTEISIERAIDYVVYGQGDQLPDDL
jgi:REP element-mobilizing transposase RayT